MASLTLTLVVDNEKNRVVFAEADKDFVDILFSFLTMPLGAIIGLLDKPSAVGCVDNLYKSVENMDTEYLETRAFKTMLLRPRSEAERICDDLKINVDDFKRRRLYRCPTFECFARTHRLYSLVSGARCPCGKEMDEDLEWIKGYNTGLGDVDGVFVKGGSRFIISDDLHVTPASSMEATLSFLQKYDIQDTEALEKKTVVITRDKVLKLLNRLMLSTTPLTDIFLRKLDTMGCGNEDEDCQLKGKAQIKSEDDSTAKSTSSIRVNILYNKVNKKVVFARGREDLVDMLFSFLTLPLGCIVKLLERFPSVGCLDNLYKSVELLDGSFGIKSEVCKNLLLAPQLYTHVGISVPALVTQVNPKLPSSGTECGGGYARKSVTFMITDDMVVTPLSPVSGIDAIKQYEVPIHSLVEKEVVLGEAEVANLLKACLISRTALTNAFCSKKMKKALY